MSTAVSPGNTKADVLRLLREHALQIGRRDISWIGLLGSFARAGTLDAEE